MCELYVDMRMREEKLVRLLSMICAGEWKGRNVRCDWVEFYVAKNDAHSWIKKRRKEDGFLYYRFTIEVSLLGDPERRTTNVVPALRKLVFALRERGAKVVPACDFEDELN